ncbi:GspE/PulE family protein [Pseudomarimonas arenosa]|uniref:Flp pilus assembly complex ATPase component TadA n=1 Tax=Pseudomarimonas arenosa TaxID=2774145 RepID=A0AAW3ZLF1_9GAMM|nr:ATPase, T2SS/T4P/T4SS family [Pseudomarimonas arenosa]MBD8525999.1 Flp pilus assembly complex ATPase component TadA [Pseudomarimonas arenosa]
MNAVAAPRKRRLGDELLAQGLITSDQLKIALFEQNRLKKPLGEVLVTLGFLTENTLREALSENLGFEAISLGDILVDREALLLIPKESARRHTLFPVSLDRQTRQLTIAISDTNNIIAMDQTRALLGDKAEPIWRLASSGEILRAIEQYYGHELSIDGILHEIETGEVDFTSLSASDASEYSHPVVRLVDAILADAALLGASDLHFEPESSFLRIRYRVDGVLRQVRALHSRYWPAMLVRLKILANMNIAENRAPQDGRISLVLAGREFDFRAAVQPTIHGENFVVRILDRKKGIVPIDSLGMRDDQLMLLKLMLSRPEGILLVTGPTGSGKTTTLYSILNYRNSEQVNIMTLEDPVEYSIPMIRQTAVSEAAKLGFADGIRSMMRQDPDIILVGEVRDRDTAEMAFRAAMTGHQVFSTLHTNSAVRSIPRLLDLGIDPEVIAGNVIGIVAQRLIRKLCTHCKQMYVAEPVEKTLLGVDDEEDLVLYRAVGCEHCGVTGYRGRVAIVEALKFDAGMDELIARRATLRDLTDYALANGFSPISDDGLRRVREGLTTIDEVARVIDLTELVNR